MDPGEDIIDVLYKCRDTKKQQVWKHLLAKKEFCKLSAKREKKVSNLNVELRMNCWLSMQILAISEETI